MFIKNGMISKEQVRAFSPDDLAAAALSAMKETGYSTLPVLRGSKFVGVISKEHIYEKLFDEQNENWQEALKGLVVGDVMDTEMSTIDEDEPIERALPVIERSHYHFLPVTDEKGDFLGIITRNAIFTAFYEGIGAETDSVRLDVVTDDFVGRLAFLTNIIASAGANILGLMTFNVKVMKLKRIIVRIKTDQVYQLVERIQENGFRVLRVD